MQTPTPEFSLAGRAFGLMDVTFGGWADKEFNDHGIIFQAPNRDYASEQWSLSVDGF